MIVKIWFYDHHDLTIRKEENDQAPRCINVAIGEVIFEDQEWLRLRHGITDLEGPSEEWEIHAIRRKDVIKIQCLEDEAYERGIEQGRQDAHDDPDEPVRDESRD